MTSDIKKKKKKNAHAFMHMIIDQNLFKVFVGVLQRHSRVHILWHFNIYV